MLKRIGRKLVECYLWFCVLATTGTIIGIVSGLIRISRL
jgi:hypothetical protein